MNAKTNQSNTSSNTARVLEVSRRFVTLYTEQEDVIIGTSASKSVELVAGDTVRYELREGSAFITERLPAERCLCRTFHGAQRRMGANIDRLCVITACGATWNPVAIDRMLAAGFVEGIPTTLIVNKTDVGLGKISEMIETYSEVGLSVLQCSAKHGHGIEKIYELVADTEMSVMALCGVSGVGKSTILNVLIPGTRAKTGEVSEKTGQGKQTTSQPRGFLAKRDGAEPAIVIDLPGVQFFGLSHLAKSDVLAAFPEIQQIGHGCKFRDCQHVKETSCAVLEALQRGEIASWRYESYLQVLDEVEKAKAW